MMIATCEFEVVKENRFKKATLIKKIGYINKDN